MPDWIWVLVIVGCTLVTYYGVVRLTVRSVRPARVDESDAQHTSEATAEVAVTPAAASVVSPRTSPYSSGAVPAGSIAHDDTAPTPSPPVKKAEAVSALPRFDDQEDDEEVDPTKVTSGLVPAAIQPPTKRIVYDEDAANDEPTNAGDLILVMGTAQTDRGKRRKRNEDSLLVLPEENLFVVADGMGGYNGGEIASRLAVETMEAAFRTQTFAGEAHTTIPWRASELARAIQMANAAILERASTDPQLQGMGTTMCAARFSPRKQRLYIGHVGDSRLYRLRGTKFEQITSDHTMATLGLTGDGAAHLSRAVGVWPTVPIDIIIGLPQPNDLYLICSDGLTKMLSDADLRKLLLANVHTPMQEMASMLVERANEAGGKDNITLILVGVRDAIGQHAAIPSDGQSQTG